MKQHDEALFSYRKHTSKNVNLKEGRAMPEHVQQIDPLDIQVKLEIEEDIMDVKEVRVKDVLVMNSPNVVVWDKSATSGDVGSGESNIDHQAASLNDTHTGLEKRRKSDKADAENKHIQRANKAITYDEKVELLGGKQSRTESTLNEGGQELYIGKHEGQNVTDEKTLSMANIESSKLHEKISKQKAQKDGLSQNQSSVTPLPSESGIHSLVEGKLVRQIIQPSEDETSLQPSQQILMLESNSINGSPTVLNNAPGFVSNADTSKITGLTRTPCLILTPTTPKLRKLDCPVSEAVLSFESDKCSKTGMDKYAMLKGEITVQKYSKANIYSQPLENFGTACT